MLSMVSPVMAAACTGTGKAVSCHEMAADHCDRSMHQLHHHMPAPASSSGLSAGLSDAPCPMDCCTPGHPQGGSVVAATSTLPPLAVIDPVLHFVPVTFTCAGFSSHTDRGPPLV
ncbi:MAG TPA: hypothetical protein VFT65_20370 [Candidatus Angelobacter sp.]|nr:hypothetical protein [Candidatus Angelobacter sp.]